MKRIIIILSSIIVCLIMILIFKNAEIRKIKPTDTLSINGDILKSSFNGKSYQLYVSLPAKYHADDPIHYPVLYVLDGTYAFPLIDGTRKVLDLGHEIEDIIIVGIGDSIKTGPTWIRNRTFDYTPSYDAKYNSRNLENLWNFQQTPKSGGAKDFLNTVQNDIIPFIDRHYNTTTDRGIVGHSLGGLFAGYCLLTNPKLFKRYGINSPSFWWNDKEILTLENSFIKTHSQLNAKVFISVGSLEPEIMLEDMASFEDSLKSANYKNLRLNSQIFDNETHLSVIPASLSRTLKVLYGVKQ